MKAGCHLVAIAQVVEHCQLKSEALPQSQVAASFSQFSIFLSLFIMYNVYVDFVTSDSLPVILLCCVLFSLVLFSSCSTGRPGDPRLLPAAVGGW